MVEFILAIVFVGACVSSFMCGFLYGARVARRAAEKINEELMPKEIPMTRPMVSRDDYRVSPFAPRPKPRPVPPTELPKVTKKLPPIDWGNGKP